jgi:hypothetical protein
MKLKDIMRYKKLNTGESYTLSTLFSRDNKIVIPDLQRDYCWGGDSNLAKDFLLSLIENESLKNRTDLNMGLIYGYELPQGHIQLCDGQQRITTLFLLLGMLNHKSKDNNFKDLLISDKELNDDKEPYLQYAIRESTLYFLSDLVYFFFIENQDLSVKDIRNQAWYFNDYDLDPSIQSMLATLYVIEEEIQNVDVESFGKYVSTRLTFMYYDMKNRKNGEETFVVINTTGEPLSATENLKPLFINRLPQEEQQSASKLWEDWETFFWLNRKGDRKGAGLKTNDTADKGFLEFFRWLILLNTKEEGIFEYIANGGRVNINDLKLPDIRQYFEIVKLAFTESEVFPNNRDWLAPESMNDQIVWFKLLPVIEYIKRFGKDDVRNVIRVKRFFENMARNGNLSKAIADVLPVAIRIIKELPSADIASMLSMENVSKQLLTDEEKLKFELYVKANNREDLENLFWEEENHKVWNGEIMPILEWSGGHDFEFEVFERYSKAFSTLFHDEMDYSGLDVTRMALLTRDLSGYPRIFRGYTNYSFCWKFSDWKTLISDNKLEFELFFHELLDKSEIEIYEKLNEMIKNNPSNKDYAEFVEIPKLIEYCEEKNMQYDSSKDCWILIARDRQSGPHANLKSYRLYLDLLKDRFWNEEKWRLDFFQSGGTYSYFEHKEKKIKIHMLFSENINGTDMYKLLLFDCEDKQGDRDALLHIAKMFDLTWRENLSADNCGYESPSLNKDVIIGNLRKMMKEMDNVFTND